ncbi:PREDICTED: uncharacterized protein LOC106808670 [Priapulus caudatus]|uniref:Bestrophin homolog n=1 Tax=Priapulus caudatus TaxID=37621 RepID=A0ABM1E456_PRICU|nr:PREDICTED: uncharacterized protein LOC106808670 [Priapulus caudatus]
MIIEGMATLTSFNIYFVPLVWCTALITRARKEGRIHDDYALKTLMDELNKIRGQYGSLFNYDWVPIPLVYTQVVTLAVYLFFIISLFCRQFLDPAQAYKGHEVDFYVPIFTVIQFLFYMGWLKVAETMVNPMGEDDDDFDLNWIIDRNIKVSYLIVDEMHAEHPELIKDQYWDEFMPELPYTAASEIYKTEAFMGSAFDVVVPSSEMDFLPTLEGIPEDQEDNERSVGYSLQINKGNTESSPVDIAPLAKMTSSGEITGVGSSSKRVNLFTKLKRQFTRQDTRASTSSLQSRRKLSLPRSTSRFSHASTINSMPAVMKVDDNIFHMSDITLAEEDIGSSCGKSNSPHWQRLNSQKESSSLSEDACSLTHSSTHAEQLLASSNAIPSTKNHPTIVTTSGQERSNLLDKSASQETITDEKNKVSSQAGVTSVFIPRSKGSYSTLDNMDKDLGTELYGSSVHRSEGFLSKLMKKKRRRNSGSESSLSNVLAE